MPNCFPLQGPDLEQWLDRSCGAYLGNDRVLVVGGFVVDEGTDTNRAYTVDLNTFSVTQENSMGLVRKTHLNYPQQIDVFCLLFQVPICHFYFSQQHLMIPL